MKQNTDVETSLHDKMVTLVPEMATYNGFLSCFL